ncbi:MAG: division/cell wall cluster transcriptional repressor MraZ [Clostridia bacterium]|nr:division/cell wall cluster transcriptional repressor MraZ [Clostridia bacterium]
MYGEYLHVIDAKGRMFLPAKFRSKLGDQVYLAKILDECVNIFSEKSFHEFMAKIENHPNEITMGRAMKRKISASVSVIDVDAQGRVLIAQKLRDLAGLGKSVVVVGMGDRVEIWNPETYEKMVNEIDDQQVEDAMKALGM